MMKTTLYLDQIILSNAQKKASSENKPLSYFIRDLANQFVLENKGTIAKLKRGGDRK